LSRCRPDQQMHLSTSPPARPANLMGDRCGVCLEEVTDRGVLDSCEHAFCFDWCGFLASSHPCSPGERSALAWAECESRCPLCRLRFGTVTRPGRAPTAVALANQVYVWDGAAFEDEEDALDAVVCAICGEGDREDELLLCRSFETCGEAVHASCSGLAQVPEDDWECSLCCARSQRRVARSATRASALSSPAATGSSLDSGGDHYELVRTISVDDPVDQERPPSPGEPPARAAAWVARQRHISAARSVEAPGATPTAGRNAALQQRASLRTVRDIRENWESLRRGVLSFSALNVQPRAGAAVAGRRARTLALAAEAPVAVHSEEEAPLDDSELSWQVLDRLRAQSERQAQQAGRRVRAERAPSGGRTRQRGRGPAQADDGFLSHLASMRRMRETGAARPRSRERTRLGADHVTARLQNASSPAPTAVGAPAPTRSFRIPKRS